MLQRGIATDSVVSMTVGMLSFLFRLQIFVTLYSFEMRWTKIVRTGLFSKRLTALKKDWLTALCRHCSLTVACNGLTGLPSNVYHTAVHQRNEADALVVLKAVSCLVAISLAPSKKFTVVVARLKILQLTRHRLDDIILPRSNYIRQILVSSCSTK